MFKARPIDFDKRDIKERIFDAALILNSVQSIASFYLERAPHVVSADPVAADAFIMVWQFGDENTITYNFVIKVGFFKEKAYGKEIARFAWKVQPFANEESIPEELLAKFMQAKQEIARFARHVGMKDKHTRQRTTEKPKKLRGPYRNDPRYRGGFYHGENRS